MNWLVHDMSVGMIYCMSICLLGYAFRCLSCVWLCVYKYKECLLGERLDVRAELLSAVRGTSFYDCLSEGREQ